MASCALFSTAAAVLPPTVDSTSLDSGVMCGDVCVLNGGRSKDVNDGEGGNGVGGLL